MIFVALDACDMEGHESLPLPLRAHVRKPLVAAHHSVHPTGAVLAAEVGEELLAQHLQHKQCLQMDSELAVGPKPWHPQ